VKKRKTRSTSSISVESSNPPSSITLGIPVRPALGPVDDGDNELENSGSKLEYQPLNRERNEFRLLQILPGIGPDSRIECNMVHASLDDSPDYDALSYAWGDTKDVKLISLNGHPFHVTANLRGALSRLRQFSIGRSIWIDAICINQRDLKERSEQVVKMDQIFKQAVEVVSWLGDGDNESELAFALLSDLKGCLKSKSRLAGIINDPQYLDHFYGLYKLFYRDYWWRVWVIQEVTMANTITLLCGHDSFPWSDLVAIQETLAKHHLEKIDEIAHKREELSFLRVSIESRGPRMMLLSEGSHGRTPDLTQTLLKHRFKQSSDPKDLIYSLVGLSTAHRDPRFVVDYSKSVRQVYTDVVEYILNTTGKLDIICAIPRGKNSHRLPSWVPDWSFDELGSSLLEHSSKHQFSAAGLSQAEVEISNDKAVLTAKGICLGIVKKVGAPTRMEDLEDEKHALETFLKWQKLLVTETKNGTALAEAFCRNILHEKYQPKEYAQWEKKPVFLQWILGAFVRAIKSTRPDLKLDAHLTKFTNYHVKWRTHKQDEILGTILLKGIAEMMFARRLFISDSKLIGVGTESIAVGDVIAVLLGCQLPVVLRAEGDHQIYLGEAFVNGYMYSKAVDELTLGKLKLQEFKIH
jgi:hypothetical protein